jgi:hypothetical protein
MRLIEAGKLGRIIKGEICVFRTPETINDDMRPTDHVELLKNALYPLVIEYGKDKIQAELESSLREICSDTLGIFCAHQCFYIEIVEEIEGSSPFWLDRSSLPKLLGSAFLRESSSMHSLELKPGDLALDRSYKVTLSGMRILSSKYGIAWGVPLPP